MAVGGSQSLRVRRSLPHETCPLRILIMHLCLPLLPLPVPFSLGFPGCLFSHLYSLSSFSGFAP